jgi:LuxR family maltose regulon positive regulatory protein
MCGPLCEAVLEMQGGSAVLADLAQSNMLLVPLDEQREWYRYHHLFGDMLRAELERLDPSAVVGLQRRAADWCLDNGLPEEALEYSIAAGAVDRVAQLVEERWLETLMRGRDATLQRWIQWLDDRGGIDDHPMVAVGGAISCAVLARSAEADRWSEWVERWQSTDAAQCSDRGTKGRAAVVQAFLCRRGIERMRADADEAAVVLPEQHVMIPLTGLLQGVARILGGDLDGGDICLQQSVAAGEDFSGPHHPVAVAERSLVAIARNQWEQAELLVEEARTLLRKSGLEESSMAGPLVCAVQARVSLHRGDTEAAREQALRAQRLRAWLSYALPYIAAQARIALTHVYLELGDVDAARTLMREIDEILVQRPDLGTIVDDARELRDELSTGRHPATLGASTLTTAELRLLPMLCTHLTTPEIANEMFLSRHTVRSQMQSIYRKLDANNRREAVTRARELRLVE